MNVAAPGERWRSYVGFTLDQLLMSLVPTYLLYETGASAELLFPLACGLNGRILWAFELLWTFTTRLRPC